jgi:hypothetical protein
MKKFILITGLLFFVGELNAQVVIGSPENKSKKETPKKKKANELKLNSIAEMGTRIYLLSNWSNSTRTLTESTGLYGDPLGERANETAAQVWSFGLGIQNDLTKHFFWDAGISYVQNGENYSFQLGDSSFMYQTRYQYVAMPLRFNYHIQKNRFHVYAGIGLMPQMYVSSKRSVDWTKGNQSNTFDEVLGEKTAPVVLSGLLNLGLLVDLKKGFSLLISPEFRFQLNSSYDKFQSYIHKNQSIGISFGLTKKIG